MTDFEERLCLAAVHILRTDGIEEHADTCVWAVGEIARLRTRVKELERFKSYVHWRLDEVGVPTHPNGPHSAEGCRIGDRLDIVLAASASTAGGAE